MIAAPTLRQYQQDMAAAVCAARAAGQNRLLLKAPTGTGKTVFFAALLKWPAMAAWLETFPKRDRRMLVIAHREELLEQAAAKIHAQKPELVVSIEQADRYAHSYSDVVIASIQTLAASKFRRLKNLAASRPFRLVIIDEAHHAAANSYRTALVHLGFLPPIDAQDTGDIEAAKFDDVKVMEEALEGWDKVAPRDRLLVGVTATPNRSDAIGLGCVFQTIAYSYALKDAIQDGWLVPIVPWVIETDTSLDDVGLNRGDFNQRELADAVNTPSRNKLAVAGWHEHAADRSTIAFTVDVAHAHALAEEFRNQGVEAAAVSGETPRDLRRSILARFTAGDVQVITNCMVLTEGTDLPRTGCILHAKPTKSATLYEQMTGRGLRIHPGKADCIVLDIVDVARRHSLQTAPVLYGLPPGLKGQGRKLEEIEKLLDEVLEGRPGFDVEAAGRLTLEELRARASTFDIWTVRAMDEYGSGLSMNWTRTGDEAFRLSYPWGDGTELLTIEKDILGHFELHVAQRSIAPASPRVLAAGVTSAQACLQLAEAFVQQERTAVMRLKDREAPWRLRAASPKQVALLSRWGVPFNPKGLTMGVASDLIDLAQARRAGW